LLISLSAPEPVTGLEHSSSSTAGAALWGAVWQGAVLTGAAVPTTRWRV